MGKDDQPKHRHAARELLRRKAQRQPAERLLIMCEGSKTEPSYLAEIRHQLRLPTANVQVQPAALGTEPLRIVEYAERLFIEGQRSLGIHTRSFDRVVVVFDRDEHHTYHAALQPVAALYGRLENDERVKVPFEAVVSMRRSLEVATRRAHALKAAGHSAEDGARPYTNMHELVHRLLDLKDQTA